MASWGRERRREELKKAWPCEGLRQSEPRRRQETAALKVASRKAATVGTTAVTTAFEESRMQVIERVASPTHDQRSYRWLTSSLGMQL